MVWRLRTTRSAVSLVGLLACLRPAGASDISGRIVLQENASRKPITAVIYDLRDRSVPAGSPRLENNRALDRVAVWLEPEARAQSPASVPIEARMQQRNRRMEPELLVIPVGSSVEFPNLDPIFHNIFSLSHAQSFDLGYYPEGHSRTVRFPRPGIVQVYCHVHPNMYGVIIVTSSPWSAKPAPDGSFSWSSVPAGKYRLMVWQKSAGLIRKKIVVPDHGSLDLTLAIPDEDPEQ